MPSWALSGSSTSFNWVQHACSTATWPSGPQVSARDKAPGGCRLSRWYLWDGSTGAASSVVGAREAPQSSVAFDMRLQLQYTVDSNASVCKRPDHAYALQFQEIDKLFNVPAVSEATAAFVKSCEIPDGALILQGTCGGNFFELMG